MQKYSSSFKSADLNYFVLGGQLYWYFPFSEDFLPNNPLHLMEWGWLWFFCHFCLFLWLASNPSPCYDEASVLPLGHEVVLAWYNLVKSDFKVEQFRLLKWGHDWKWCQSDFSRKFGEKISNFFLKCNFNLLKTMDCKLDIAQGILMGESITVLLTSCLTGLD